MLKSSYQLDFPPSLKRDYVFNETYSSCGIEMSYSIGICNSPTCIVSYSLERIDGQTNYIAPFAGFQNQEQTYGGKYYCEEKRININEYKSLQISNRPYGKDCNLGSSDNMYVGIHSGLCGLSASPGGATVMLSVTVEEGCETDNQCVNELTESGICPSTCSIFNMSCEGLSQYTCDDLSKNYGCNCGGCRCEEKCNVYSGGCINKLFNDNSENSDNRYH